MRVTISKLVVTSASILTLIAMSAISYFTWQSSIDAIYSLNKSSYMQSTHALSEQLATPVRFKKLDNIKERLDVAFQSSEGNLSHVSIYLPDKTLLYSTHPSSPPLGHEGELEAKHVILDNSDRFEFGTPLLSGKKNTLVGYLVTDWNFSQAQGLSSALSNQSVIIGLISVVVCIGVLVLLLRNTLTTPLHQLNLLCHELSSGDCNLSKRLEFKHDNELGQLAKGMNRFIEKMEQTLTPIHHGADSVTAISQDLDKHLISIGEQINHQRDEIKATVSLGEQAQHSVSQVKDNSLTTSGKLSHAVNSAKSGQQRLLSALENNRLMAQKSSNISEAATEVNSQVQKVTEILGIIRNIAEQTNLLALNAAIEAARAGENGRGFAVVADEVRGLAEKTANSTNQVEDILNALGDVSNNLIQFTQEGSKASEASLASIEDTVGDIEQALNDVSEANQVCADIESSSHAQMTTMSDLVCQLVNIDQRIDRLAGDSNLIEASSNKLYSQAKDTSKHLSCYNLS
ncbi:methyl-accepting chemotaxis protein [Vibrio paucivorans]